MDTFYKFALGDFDCIALEDNQRDIDVREELVQVDEEKLLAAMKANAYEGFDIRIGFNCLLIDTGSQNILIDAGSGKDKLSDSLMAAGYSNDQIDVIVVTHSDFDHIGGLQGFPNAKIIFPSYAYELWTTEKSRIEMIENFKSVFSKFLPADFVSKGAAYREHYGSTILPSLKDRITLVEADEEFLRGFRLVFAPGHRPDHYAVEITSGDQTLMHIADAFRHAVQIENPNWYSRVDSYPEQMAESLSMLVKKAIEKDALLFGSHFQFPGLAKIKDGKLKMFSC